MTVVSSKVVTAQAAAVKTLS